ncbi:MAG: virulence-associated E family protein, partial [Pseudomonadota bacterium]
TTQATAILENLAERYFGVSDPLYNTYLRRTLIAAVQRIFEPGCKVDTVLILQGPQGYRKSTFFKVLAGPQYFDDSLGSMSDKDERLKLHLVWICEWPELESVFRRKDIADTKAFLSSGEDLVRPPYGRETKRMPRQSIIVGSTNQEQFLNDPTGNRRFWVVPVKQPIDIERLEQERDRLWGAAMALYRAGEPCWLTSEEEHLSETLAADYQTTDPWDARIAAHIMKGQLTSVTTNELLTDCLELEVGHQHKGHQMRAAECLKRMGWHSIRKQHHGKRQRVWLSPGQPKPPDTNQVVRGRNHDSVEISAAHDRPGQPNTTTFTSNSNSISQKNVQTEERRRSPVSQNGHGLLTEQRLE